MDNATSPSSRPQPTGSLLPPREIAGGNCAADASSATLTHFGLDFPITVDLGVSTDAASELMGRLGVRALLVISEALTESDAPVVGLVTASAMERTRHHGGNDASAHRRVGDVMIAWDDLSVIKYQSMQSLTDADVHELFQGTGLTHLIVVDTAEHGKAIVRGILSRAAFANRRGRLRARASP